MTSPEFLASVDMALLKVARKVTQENASREALNDPHYWVKQQARMHDPKARSYDALAPFIFTAQH